MPVYDWSAGGEVATPVPPTPAPAVPMPSTVPPIAATPASVDGAIRLGCYADKDADRIMQEVTAADSMTAQVGAGIKLWYVSRASQCCRSSYSYRKHFFCRSSAKLRDSTKYTEFFDTTLLGA